MTSFDSTSGTVEFLDHVRKIFAKPEYSRYENVSVVATQIAQDGAAVIIYTARADGPLLGLHVDVGEFATLFSPGKTPRDIAEIVAGDEMVDPSGPGTPMEVDWADGLVERGREKEIGWRAI